MTQTFVREAAGGIQYISLAACGSEYVPWTKRTAASHISLR
jgi:hypothetical protein